jgi:hypothetical protein
MEFGLIFTINYVIKYIVEYNFYIFFFGVTRIDIKKYILLLV